MLATWNAAVKRWMESTKYSTKHSISSLPMIEAILKRAVEIPIREPVKSVSVVEEEVMV